MIFLFFIFYFFISSNKFLVLVNYNNLSDKCHYTITQYPDVIQFNSIKMI